MKIVFCFHLKKVNNILLSFVYESDAFNGVAELLEILGSIINGFAIPIKAEHKLFLTKVFILVTFRFFSWKNSKKISIFHSVMTFVFCSVLSGATKLKLFKVLIPLHKSPRYSSFQGQLAYCIVQFVEKEPYLTHVIIGSILKFWPVTNSTKAVSFTTTTTKPCAPPSLYHI